MKASTRIKVSGQKTDEGEQYIEVGEEVDESDFSDKDWADLVLARSVVPDEEFDVIHPEVVLGQNQAFGTPSNLAQIEGTTLQVNSPEVDEETGGVAPGAVVEPRNPADPVRVEGAVDPGDGSDAN